MSSRRERLQAALAGELADRPPVALWRHFPVDDQDPETLAQATLSFQAEFDFDFVKVTPASSFCLRDWGAEDEWRGDPEGTRSYTRRVVLEPEGWARLPELDPESGGLAAQLFVLERLRDRLGGDTPILQTVFSPLAQAKNLAGEATLFEHLHRDPESVQAGLETIARTTVRFVEAASRRGIAGVFYAVQHASFHYFDSQSYARIAEAHDRRILEAAGGLRLNLLHLHGQALMFDLGGRLPAQVVNWHDRETGPSLAEGKARCGKAVCGGLQRQATLVLGTPEAVRAEARQALEAVGRRGVILGAGCVVPIVAPRANLMAARRAVDFA